MIWHQFMIQKFSNLCYMENECQGHIRSSETVTSTSLQRAGVRHRRKPQWGPRNSWWGLLPLSPLLLLPPSLPMHADPSLPFSLSPSIPFSSLHYFPFSPLSRSGPLKFNYRGLGSSINSPSCPGPVAEWFLLRRLPRLGGSGVVCAPHLPSTYTSVRCPCGQFWPPL